MAQDEKVAHSWAVVELMGHVKMAGRVYEVQRFGATLGAIDIPDTNAGATSETFKRTQLFSGASIYRVTYCTEETARVVANEQARWEQPTTHYQALPGPRDEPPATYVNCGTCGGLFKSSLLPPHECLACATDREDDSSEQGDDVGEADPEPGSDIEQGAAEP